MRIKIGYQKLLYEEAGIKISASIRSEGSILLSGATGTGKSTLLFFIMHQYIVTLQRAGLDLWVADFKNAMPFLRGCKRYLSEIETIATALHQFYTSFENTRKKGRDGMQHVFVIDEYFALMSLMEVLSKTDKATKELYLRMLMETSVILAMGRSLGYTLVVCVQQASVKAFQSSADRENFINKISLGSMSSISANMIFESTDLDDINFQKSMPVGTGFYQVIGEGAVKEFISPQIINQEEMLKGIRRFLDEIS